MADLLFLLLSKRTRAIHSCQDSFQLEGVGFMRLLAILLLLLPPQANAQSLSLPDGRPVSAVNVSILVFSQIVAFRYPYADLASEPDYQVMDPDRLLFLSEWVPEGENLEDWTQMFTVMGARDATAALSEDAINVLLESRIAELIGLYERGCDAPISIPQNVPIPGGARASRGIFLACTEVSGTQHGEAMMAMAIAGSHDLYTLQSAVRFPVGLKGLYQFPVESWQPRMQLIVDSFYCTPPEENPDRPQFCM